MSVVRGAVKISHKTNANVIVIIAADEEEEVSITVFSRDDDVTEPDIGVREPIARAKSSSFRSVSVHDFFSAAAL